MKYLLITVALVLGTTVTAQETPSQKTRSVQWFDCTETYYCDSVLRKIQIHTASWYEARAECDGEYYLIFYDEKLSGGEPAVANAGLPYFLIIVCENAISKKDYAQSYVLNENKGYFEKKIPKNYNLKR